MGAQTRQTREKREACATAAAISAGRILKLVFAVSWFETVGYT
jgi:hypothetical protein